MKMFRIIPALMLLVVPCVCAEQERDVWYDASGKVVGTTKAVKEKEPFVPEWQKRENERLEAQRTGNYNDRIYHRSRSSWDSGYSPYYYGGYSACYPRGYRHHGHHRSRWGFRGSYHGNGWSVRVGY